jgi:hypothetical protein
MKQVVWMTAGCAVGWMVAVAVAGHGREVFFGMLGPLLASCATWLVVARAHRRNPSGVAGVMMAAFAVKMLFFGVYVVLAMRLGQLEMTPFAAAFAVFFVSLYVVQAMLVQRLAAPPAA